MLNPLRYRGYVYDEGIGLYYVSSRYYNPVIGRFINADDIDLLGANGDFASLNLFAYCGNNPVSRADSNGYFWVAALVGGVVNVATTFIAAKATGQEYSWKDAAVAALAGAANAIPVVGPLLNGLITGGYTGYMGYKNGASIGQSIFVGTVAAVCSTASISNLANFQGPALDLVTNAAVDLVFGTGNNGIAAATYKVVTDSAKNKAHSNSNISRNTVNISKRGVIRRGNVISVRGLTM